MGIFGTKRLWKGKLKWYSRGSWLPLNSVVLRNIDGLLQISSGSEELETQRELSKMAQQGKTLATKPDDPSSIPGMHLVEGEN